jgi:hypothetical protein
VSSDGKQIAYFTSGTTSELRISSASDPSRSQLLTALGADQGGGLVWANDASGLLYSVVHSADSAPTSDIRTIDVAGATAGPARVIFTSSTVGVFLQPIAWDRANSRLAFGETGEGGFMGSYDVTHFVSGQPNTTRAAVPAQIVMHTVQASSDAHFVVGYDLSAAGFTFWPLDTMSGAGHHPPESKYGTRGALWRPGTHEIGFIGPSDQFWLCDVDKEVALGCGRTAFSGVPQGAQVQAFRADGSAVLLGVASAAGGPTQYTLVRLTPENPKATTGDRVTFEDAANIGPGVRLR